MDRYDTMVYGMTSGNCSTSSMACANVPVVEEQTNVATNTIRPTGERGVCETRSSACNGRSSR